MNWEIFALGFAAVVLLTLLGGIVFVFREAAKTSDHRRSLELIAAQAVRKGDE